MTFRENHREQSSKKPSLPNVQSMETSSRLPGFYELPPQTRLNIASRTSGLSQQDSEALSQWGALTPELVDVFIENGIGTFALPLGVATNFQINGTDTLIPMAVEETSVLAAASFGAKLARSNGGFVTDSSAPVMTGQIQIFLNSNDVATAIEVLKAQKVQLLHFANRGQERLVARGGGAKDLDWHFIPEMNSIVLHLYIDTCNAMGANIVNSLCERVAKVIPELIDGNVGLRILSNLCDRRTARARCKIKASAFTNADYSGEEMIDRIVNAYLFAFYDPYRAATHNKGIMNGIDPVLIATGNDWRAVEAGAHAYACRSGQYRPMTTWSKDSDGLLSGELEIPMAVGTVGGVTKLHPTAQAALRMMGSPDSSTLAEIICAVGLAQNLSALRALAAEGIQKGHMSLHSKNIELLRRSGTGLI